MVNKLNELFVFQRHYKDTAFCWNLCYEVRILFQLFFSIFCERLSLKDNAKIAHKLNIKKRPSHFV